MEADRLAANLVGDAAVKKIAVVKRAPRKVIKLAVHTKSAVVKKIIRSILVCVGAEFVEGVVVVVEDNYPISNQIHVSQ